MRSSHGLSENLAAGADSMIHLYRQIKGSAAKDGFDFGEGELNSLGYHLMRSDRVDDAIKIFTLNTEVPFLSICGEKAATLLYLIIKNHSFVDGNKPHFQPRWTVAASMVEHKKGVLPQ